ncbi:MAG: hypothetical protein ACYS8W_19435, partial [Planctomycetota bacterium]
LHLYTRHLKYHEVFLLAHMNLNIPPRRLLVFSLSRWRNFYAFILLHFTRFKVWMKESGKGRAYDKILHYLKKFPGVRVLLGKP